jgi:hypothetical protein
MVSLFKAGRAANRQLSLTKNRYILAGNRGAMNREPDIFERIGKLFTGQPKYLGVFVIAAGNRDWVFLGRRASVRYRQSCVFGGVVGWRVMAGM